MLYIRIGYLLAVAGAGVRVWCYKTLARYFTFEIAVQDDQKVRPHRRTKETMTQWSEADTDGV